MPSEQTDGGCQELGLELGALGALERARNLRREGLAEPAGPGGEEEGSVASETRSAFRDLASAAATAERPERGGPSTATCACCPRRTSRRPTRWRADRLLRARKEGGELLLVGEQVEAAAVARRALVTAGRRVAPLPLA